MATSDVQGHRGRRDPRHRWRWPSCLLLLVPLIWAPAEAVEGGGAPLPGWAEWVEPALRGGDAHGTAVFPAEFVAGEMSRITDPTGYRVLMVTPRSDSAELVFSAGTPFTPPPGQRLIWIEGAWDITPFRDLVHFHSGGSGMASSTLFLPTVPGGRIHVPEGPYRGKGDSEFWLLHLGGSSIPGWLGHPLLRRRAVRGLDDGVLMPAAPTVAAVWSRRGGSLEALSRPFTPPPGESSAAPLEQPPAGRAFLLVHLVDPAAVTAEHHGDLEPKILQGSRALAPDVRYVTPWGLYAIWYDLEAGAVRLTAENDGLYLEEQPLELAAGDIGWVETPLHRRPRLEVTLVLPASLRSQPLRLTVRRVRDGEVLAEAGLARTAGRHRFDHLEHGLLDLELETHLGSFHQRVELGIEEERLVVLEPELIRLEGTVFYGGDPHPAKLKFLTVAGEEIRATADDDGRYEVHGLQAIRYVSVDLEEVDVDPWIDFLHPPIGESRVLDLPISDARWSVQVSDAVTGRGVGGARVAVGSEYLEGSGSEQDRRPRKIGQSYTTDDEGLARLPAPRPGQVEIEVFADGYRRMPEALKLQGEDPPVSRDLVVQLQPRGDTIEAQLHLADGSPAVGAGVLRLASLDDGEVLFSGVTDAQGVVEIPREPATGSLVLRHSGAASEISEWAGWVTEERVDWRFKELAAWPLEIRALDAAGNEPAPWSPVAVWIDGRRFAGAALRHLFGASATTDQHGFWRAEGLGRSSLEILVWDRRLDTQAADGTLDTLTTEIRFPWPSTIEIRVVQ